MQIAVFLGSMMAVAFAAPASPEEEKKVEGKKDGDLQTAAGGFGYGGLYGGGLYGGYGGIALFYLSKGI